MSDEQATTESQAPDSAPTMESLHSRLKESLSAQPAPSEPAAPEAQPPEATGHSLAGAGDVVTPDEGSHDPEAAAQQIQEGQPDQAQVPPALADQFAKLMDREREIREEKESFSKERGFLEEIKQLREGYSTSKADAVAKAVQLLAGVDSDSLDTELSTVYDELTYRITGIEPTGEHKQSLEQRKLSAELNRLKKQIEDKEKLKTEEQKKADVQKARTEAISSIGNDLKDPEIAKQFPSLAALPSENLLGAPAAELVWRYVEHNFSNGNEVSVVDAAREIEKQLSELTKTLSSASSGHTAPDSEEKRVPPSNTSLAQAKSPRTIDTSSAPTQPEATNPDLMDDEYEHNLHSFKKLQEMLKGG